MSDHITWESMVNNMIHGSWGRQGGSPAGSVKDAGYAELQTALLLDIAKSLRVLRCADFTDIPSLLRKINSNTRKKKRKQSR